MAKDLSNYRKSYEKTSMDMKSMDANPFKVFQTWFDDIDGSRSDIEANAMTLSTFELDGYPRNRVVLLKEVTDEGFIFYTNYTSQKGMAIAKNNKVCLSFFWHKMERQVIIKGKASRVSEAKSFDYFTTRPRGSQLGALISDQSKVIPSRDYLDEKLKEAEHKYSGIDIPKPKDWGGYLVSPVEIEFWQGRRNRLHDRIRYTKQKDGSWTKDRLSP